MFKKIFIDLCNSKKESPTAVCMKLGLSNAAFSSWTDNTVPRKATLQRIADYFGVSVDYLLGETDQNEKIPVVVSDEDLKIALFGGDTEVTDEMWHEVMNYAEFIKQKYGKN